jgi:steroid delta-isomerase-like uncharacterized protein
MSTEQNKSLARYVYEEIFNTGNFEALAEVSAPDFVDHSPSPGQAPGVEGVIQSLTGLREAFPDMTFTVEDMIAEGDKVVSRLTMRGTHNGEFMGVPATGRPVAQTGIDIVRIVDGIAVERWGEFDNLGLMQQLGLIPS